MADALPNMWLLTYPADAKLQYLTIFMFTNYVHQRGFFVFENNFLLYPKWVESHFCEPENEKMRRKIPNCTVEMRICDYKSPESYEEFLNYFYNNIEEIWQHINRELREPDVDSC